MRVLIISTFFPPLNNIASHRMAAFEKYLRDQGLEVDVITRYYDDERSQGKSMHIYQDGTSGIREPYLRKSNIVYTNYEANTPQIKRFRRLPPGIRGLYAYLRIDVYAYGWIDYVKQAFDREFSGNKYDFILASYGPPVALLAAKKIADQHNIPLIADYRDIFINEGDKGYHRFLKKRQQQFLLRNAAGMLFVSKGMQDFFNLHASSRIKKIPSAIVMNGVEDAVFAGQKEKHDGDATVKDFMQLKQKYQLVLLHPGTVYPGQDIGFFTNAIQRFNQAGAHKIALVFLGFAQDIRDKKSLEGEHVYFFEKVGADKSFYLQQIAGGLVLPVWKNRYTGFSGKLLEYMASQNLVFSGPGMQQDVKEFTQRNGNIVYHANEEELLHSFEQCIKGELNRKTIDEEQLQELKRSYWVKTLKNFLEGLKINKK